MASKRQTDADQKAHARALAKKSNVGGEMYVPMTKQPEYPVPDDVRELRDNQTADWDLSEDIRILRFYIASETKKGGNAALVAQLAKQVESLIRTNVSTALRTGEWLSRGAARDLGLAMQNEVATMIRPYIPDDDDYSDFMQELSQRLHQYTSRAAAAAANERNQ